MQHILNNIEFMEKGLGNFSLTSDSLSFTSNNQVLKTVIKNLSLKTTSYDISIPDSDHFKVLTHRMFGLAPGMSKTIHIKHIDGEHCKDEEKQIRKIKVTNSYKKSHIIYCRCPEFVIKEPEKLVHYPCSINVGEFDKQKTLSIPFTNISSKNLKIIFKNKKSSNYQITFPILEKIILENSAADMSLTVTKEQHGSFESSLQFQIYQENQQCDNLSQFCLKLFGESVNRALIVKDTNEQSLGDIKHQLVNGTKISNDFYLQNKYTKATNYQIQTTINAENPVEYAKKWKNCSMTISEPQGCLPPLSKVKISYLIETHYNQDDENYVLKYSKIGLTDDVSSLRVKNTQYSRKSADIFLKIYFSPQKITSRNPEESLGDSEECIATKPCSRSINIKCLIVNPSIRYELTHVESSIDRLTLLNESKISLPFNFSLHSLYRIKPMKGLLPNGKKEFFVLKWNKDKEKCDIFIELPEFDLPVYLVKQLKDKSVIDRPASRRPQTSMKSTKTEGLEKQTIYRNNPFSTLSTYASRPSTGMSLRPTSPFQQYFAKKIKNIETGVLMRQIPKFFQVDKIPTEQLDCLIVSEDSTNILNTHKTINAIIEIMGVGFLILAPGQRYFFNERLLDKGLNFRVYGHQHTYRLLCPRDDKNRRIEVYNKENISSQRNLQGYKILNRDLKMVFRESKTEFQVTDSIPIRNVTSQPLHVYCVTVDGEFFQSKEENNHLVIDPNDVGHFKIAFFPKNCIRLGLMRKNPPTEKRKAQVKNIIDIDKKEGSCVEKEIELMIGKNIEKINCSGELNERKCQTRPQVICFKDCKYGSAECTQTFLITNFSSSKKINFMVEYPEEVLVRPKTGTIGEKGTLACTVLFKPSKKIENYRQNIRIYIQGSHMELIPLKIDVTDPDIYIKEDQIIPIQSSIYGGEDQQLYAEMTLVNNNPSQCHVELDLTDTELFLGYVNAKNMMNEKGLVIENFFRNSRVNQDLQIKQNVEEEQEKQEEEEETSQNRREISQKCCTTVPQQSTLIIPLTFKPSKTEIGINRIKIKKDIAKMIGFGAIKSPKYIQYEGKKTLIQITPSQTVHDIVLTKNQEIYQINLKNVSNKSLKVRTELIQQKNSHEEMSMICTYKDINDEMRPDASIDLAMSFIAFDGQKNAITSEYFFNIYVCEGPMASTNPYLSTKLNVYMPQPFLQISPTVLVMPTVALNSWARSSFTITNQGHKEIFIKIKKPSNIAFELEHQIVTFEASSTQSTLKLKNAPGISKKEQNYLENQLTRLRNCVEVKLFFRSKSRISFNTVLEIHDNYENKYEMTVAGTATDCPLFQPETVNSSLFENTRSSNQMGSHNAISSFTSISSSSSMKNREQLSPADIEDLLFLNNWLGVIIPELSNESVFFYVWMTKVENFLKFLKEFNVTLYEDNNKHKPYQGFQSLKEILQTMKKNGFLFNSLRVNKLQKGQQLEWLHFMWYFISHQIVSKDSLVWINKTLKYQQSLNYELIQSNFHRLLTEILEIILETKATNKTLSDWKTVSEQYDPLFNLFNCMESKRHLILCVNLFHHKAKKVEKSTIFSTALQFQLSVENNESRRVKYFLVCPNKKVSIYQSSNKTLPTPTQGGYSFSIEQNQQVELSLAIKDSNFRNTSSCMKLVLFDNTLWNPINVYTIKIKQSQTITHDVVIECEEKCSQVWVNKFQSKLSSEYTLSLQGSNEYKCHTSSHLGYLKKGQFINIKIEYNPASMESKEAILEVCCPFTKEMFKIKGKPLHSTAIQFEKNIKVCQGEVHQQVIWIPWQRKAQGNSVSSRNCPKYTIINYGKTIIQNVIKSVQYSKVKQEMKVVFTFNIEKLYRNLQGVYKIHNQDGTESKLIKVIIDIIPKPIIIHADIEAELYKTVLENIKIYPLAGIGENVVVEYCSIKSQEEVTGKKKKIVDKYEPNNSYLQPFSISGKVNTLSLLNNSGDLVDFREITLKYHPIKILDEDPLFYVNLSYTQSLYDIRYIFRGRMARLKNLIPFQPRLLKHECLPLQRYKGTIMLTNQLERSITYEVKTDLNQILGNPEFILEPNQSLKYAYEIYCLHLGNKKGKIIFCEKDIKVKSAPNTEQFTIQITILNPKKPIENLRIYNQKFQIKSQIREQKTLQIGLQNHSSKIINYEVKNNSYYLKCAKSLQIQPHSEQTLKIQHLALFTGKKQATIQIYNPYQPQIKYEIQMQSQPHFERITEKNEFIGHYTIFRLNMYNPLDQPIQFKPLKYLNLLTNLEEEFQYIQFSHTTLKPRSSTTIEAFMICKCVQKMYSYLLILGTEEIGEYQYELNYTYNKLQTMEIIALHLEEGKPGQGEFIFSNPFRESIEVQILPQFKQCIQIDTYELKQNYNGYYKIKEMDRVSIGFKVIKSTVPIMKISICEKNHKYSWVYPIHIYQTYMIDKQPILLKGNADENIFVKVFPKRITAISNIKLEFTDEDQLHADIQVVNECIRTKNPYIDGRIQQHKYLKENQIYEVEMELKARAAFDGQGYIMLYQNQSSLKQVMEINSNKMIEDNATLHKVEKIPFVAHLAEPKAEIINFTANVGEISRVQLRIENEKNKNRSMMENKADEYKDTQLLLYNNKSREFSVVLLKDEGIVEISYHAKQYSGLKNARLEVKRKGETSHFELRGRFPNKKK